MGNVAAADAQAGDASCDAACGEAFADGGGVVSFVGDDGSGSRSWLVDQGQGFLLLALLAGGETEPEEAAGLVATQMDLGREATTRAA